MFYISLEAGYFKPAVVEVQDGVIAYYDDDAVVVHAVEASEREVASLVDDGLLIPVSEGAGCMLGAMAVRALDREGCPICGEAQCPGCLLDIWSPLWPEEEPLAEAAEYEERKGLEIIRAWKEAGGRGRI